MVFLPKVILVPLAVEPEDDFALAQFSVEAACDIAAQFHANLILFTVAAPLMPGSSASVDVSGKIYHAVALVLQARLTRGREQLATLQAIAQKRGISADARILESEDSIAHVVCDAVKENKADLVIVGSRARKGLRSIFVGSVAERIVHLSPAPVLLLHPPS